MTPSPSLRRVLGFWALVAYGVGDILGAGIYALIGKVAGVVGIHCWAAFALAAVAASLTALSYAELGSRIPRSGGAAAFCQRAFHSDALTRFVGWLVLCSGMVSMATVSHAFAGYLQAVAPAPWPPWLVVITFLVVLAVINFLGMRESSAANVVCTIVEGSGLLLVIGASVMWLRGGAAALEAPAVPLAWPALAQGGALAFFALIGFEDMVNVAEETRAPERDLPRAIVTALAIAAVLYMAVAWLAVRVVPPAELAASSAPLLAVVQRAAPAVPAGLFMLVALCAVSNTALLNGIMGSRLLHGMARDRLVPSWLGRVHPRRRTPHLAILAVLVMTGGLALSGTLVHLAGATSALILTVFIAANAALLALKRREPASGRFRIHSLVPWLGAVASLALLAFVPMVSLRGAGLLAAVGLILTTLHRPRPGRA